ncbi:MAG: Flp pilus assembly protein CpaB [Geodermatophilaceae bacterium]
MPVRTLLPLSSLALSPRWLSARRLAAALLAAAALILAVTPVAQPPTATREPPQSAVLVAAQDLPAGRTIGTDDLRSAERTSAQLPDGALTPGMDVVGRVVTGSVRRGEVMTDRRLLGPGLSASLDAGVVASPVRLVDLEVAALLRAGDRVDILAAVQDAPSATVVAAGVVVLAVPLAESEDSRPAEPIGLVVVAVDQDTAARLAAAAASGTLTATLLPP